MKPDPTGTRLGSLLVPELHLYAEGNKGLLQFPAETANLTPETPQVVTLDWSITSVYLPVTAYAVFSPEDPLDGLGVTATINITLRRYGDIVWFSEQKTDLLPDAARLSYSGHAAAFVGDWAITDDLTNPIWIGPNARLELEAKVSMVARNEEGAEANGWAAEFNLNEGILRYEIERRT